MNVTETKTDYVITIPKHAKPVQSSSGKSFILASSGGFSQTGLSLGDSPISANVTLTHKNPDYVKPPK
jgi:hypothetical protein